MYEKLITLLRWSEKYTKTDMVYLGTNGFWIGVGQLATVLNTLIIMYLFTNYVPMETYGQYKFILSVAGILLLSSLGGFSTALIRFSSRTGNILSFTFRIQLMFGVIGSLAASGISLYYYLNDNHIFTIAFLIVALFVPLLESLNLYRYFLQGKQNFKYAEMYNALTHLIAALVLGATILVTDNLLAYVTSYFLAFIIPRTFFFLKTNYQYPSQTNIDTTTQEEVVYYGKHFSVMSALQTLSVHIDKILIFHFLGAAPVAIYALSTAIPDSIKGILKNFSFVIFPKFAQSTPRDAQKQLGKILFLYGSLVTLITIIYIITSPRIFTLLFPLYTDSIFFSQIYSITVLATMSVIPSTFLNAHAQTRTLYYFHIVTVTVRLISVGFGIYFFGLLGAVVARVLTRFVELGYAVILTKNKLHY